MHVVATAGHVDHGKSTLVWALTGTDPDRWAEEKARGLTIDLGFAVAVLPSGRDVGFVDVPGHVRFLKNMLAGVGAVDACLFVVAATEGWKPQSEEHLRILDVLGVGAGVVVLTMVDRVDDDVAALRALEVAERTAGTFLADAEVVAVDSVGGRGVDALRDALDRLLAGVPPSVDRGRPRLWVDRSFAVRGAGTVVTGTLTGGALAVGDEVAVLPAGRAARVRGMQSHGLDVARAAPGRRLALNLVGVGHGEVGRGDAVVRAAQWAPSRTVDCSLTVLAGVGHDVSRRGAYLAYVGSGEHAVAVRVLGGAAWIGPGATGFVRLHLPVALPLVPGDRYVLRESGRDETVGGGEVLDVAPVLPAAHARPSRSAARVVAERGWVEVDVLERLTGEPYDGVTVGRWAVSAEAHAEAVADVQAAVDAAGPAGLDLARLDERHRAVAEGTAGLVVADGHVTAADSGDARWAAHPYLVALQASPLAPPPPDGADRAELRALVRRGLIVECDGVFFAASAVLQATDLVTRSLHRSPEGLTVSELRKTLGTSRKFALPLLAHLDRVGVTVRRRDLRVLGGKTLALSKTSDFHNEGDAMDTFER